MWDTNCEGASRRSVLREIDENYFNEATLFLAQFIPEKKQALNPFVW
jgi:hypothetical protein